MTFSYDSRVGKPHDILRILWYILCLSFQRLTHRVTQVSTLSIQLFDTNIFSRFIADVTRDGDYCQAVDLVIGLLKLLRKTKTFLSLLI